VVTWSRGRVAHVTHDALELTEAGFGGARGAGGAGGARGAGGASSVCSAGMRSRVVYASAEGT